MALATEALKVALEKDILDILNSPISEKSSDAEVKNNFAKKLAEAIGNRMEAWIKTGIVTVQPGIAVTTPAGPGATSAPGTGSIS